jgi:hypothetical protein
MGVPDTSPELWQQGEYSDTSLLNIASNAANMRFGTNPAYTLSDFVAIFPQFGSVDVQGVFTGKGNLTPGAMTMFLNLASASLSQERWQDSWSFGMALFIAHYATLFQQSSTSVMAGLAKGVQVSKSAGDVSTSIQTITTGWESWGAWNLTTFGQQLITMARTIGYGPMWIW